MSRPARRGLTGNEAVALAWKQINPDVVAAYPITPSTQVVERFSQYVADGEATTEFIPVESEHSAMSACIGAAAAGARVMTATSSQGLALMHEMLYIASGLRLPVVMTVANRSLSAPINIHGDHSDAMGSRDAGWIQLYCRDVQETYETTILAVRIAEAARLPVMVCLDGFTLSHALEPVEPLPDAAIGEYLGEPRPAYTVLDPAAPVTVGPLSLPDSDFEFRRAHIEAMRRALLTIMVETAAFNARFDRRLPALLDLYQMEGAQSAALLLGSYADLMAAAVDRSRADGMPVGLIRLRAFRPFPQHALREATACLRALGVMDRADTLSTLGGPLGIEVRAALYDMVPRPEVLGAIYALGGRELTMDDARSILASLVEGAPRPERAGAPTYVGVRDTAPHLE